MMTTTIRKEPINSVFPPLGNEVKHFEALNIEIPTTYNKKVMIQDWQLYLLAEPRDTTDFFPPKGHLHMASYKNLGDKYTKTGISETHAMLEQIKTKCQQADCQLTRSAHRNQNSKMTRMEKYTGDYGYKNYRTTTEIDYPSHFSMTPKEVSTYKVPFLMNRRTIGHDSLSFENSPGIRTFVDDDMELHDKIADLKMHRHVSYDPIVKSYTDVCKYKRIRMNT